MKVVGVDKGKRGEKWCKSARFLGKKWQTFALFDGN